MNCLVKLVDSKGYLLEEILPLLCAVNITASERKIISIIILDLDKRMHTKIYIERNVVTLVTHDVLETFCDENFVTTAECSKADAGRETSAPINFPIGWIRSRRVVI